MNIYLKPNTILDTKNAELKIQKEELIEEIERWIEEQIFKHDTGKYYVLKGFKDFLNHLTQKQNKKWIINRQQNDSIYSIHNQMLCLREETKTLFGFWKLDNCRKIGA